MERLPIAVILPHAGLNIPDELRDITCLTPAQIFNEADAYAEHLYQFADKVLYWEMFPYARALIDINRADDQTSARPGDGIVKRITSYGQPVYTPGHEPAPDLERALIRRYWLPWHQRLAAVAADPRVKLVIDAHTMAAVGPTSYGDPLRLRPRVSVGNLGDRQGAQRFTKVKSTSTPEQAQLLARTLGREFAHLPTLTPTGADVAINDPFYGGENLRQHGGRRQPWLMIEVSRALYIGHQEGDSPIALRRDQHIRSLRSSIWHALQTLLESIVSPTLSM